MESLPWWEPFHGPAESTHRVSCWDPSGDRAKSVCLRREFVQPPSFYNLLPSRRLSCCSQAQEGTLKCCFCRDFQAFQSLDGMFPTPQEIFGVQAALKTAVCWPCCWQGRGVSNVECKMWSVKYRGSTLSRCCRAALIAHGALTCTERHRM